MADDLVGGMMMTSLVNHNDVERTLSSLGGAPVDLVFQEEGSGDNDDEEEEDEVLDVAKIMIGTRR